MHSLRQELGHQDPIVLLRLIRTYILHLYGCTMWDIFSVDAVQLWTTWHRIVKSAYELPLPTHRYLLNDLVNGDHLKKMIIKRFIKFSLNIDSSKNPHVAVLHKYQSKDWRSTYGRNCMNICREAGVTNISKVDMHNIKVNPVPPGEEWRVGLLKDILSERDVGVGFLTKEDIDIIIKSVCCD